MVSPNDVRRLFLQAVFSRAIISDKLAKTIWLKSIEAVQAANDGLNIPHSGTQEEWDAFVKSVNDSLNDLDFEFRLSHDEISGKKMYGLVNLKDDEIAQMATDYTPAEITYFKAIIEQIMLSPNEAYSVSSIAALREVSAVKNMSKTQAEIVLGSFVAKGWLLRSKRGRYSLGSRSLLELAPYLKSTYGDGLLECTICLDTLTKGIRCNTAQCKARVHYQCFKNHIASSKRAKREIKCPSCSNKWPEENVDPLLPVGEAAAKDGQDVRRHVRQKDDADSDEEDAEEGMYDDDTPPQTQAESSQPKRTQKSRGKGKAKKIDVDSDEDAEGDDDEEEDDTPVNTQVKRRSSRR